MKEKQCWFINLPVRPIFKLVISDSQSQNMTAACARARLPARTIEHAMTIRSGQKCCESVL
jgi:hypothetical protein